MVKKKKYRKEDVKQLKKTLRLTLWLCIFFPFLITVIQLNGNNEDKMNRCNSQDPIIVDILSFIVAIFLTVEGFCRIIEHPNATLKRQFTRIIRVGFGFTIFSLHMIHSINKLF
ncbi:MAG: hypothetical protein WC867_00895 [Candidatus Pacearchaeota archaeon]|jgi:hypothetical protein